MVVLPPRHHLWIVELKEDVMAVCRYCGQEMSEADGCSTDPITIRGRSYAPIRFGTERGRKSSKGPCGDCGVKRGAVHHHGCDIEACPACGDQSISCGCVWAGEEHLQEDWVDEMEDRLLM
jgi:hypothetical protein